GAKARGAVGGATAPPVPKERGAVGGRARRRGASRHWHTVADRAAHVLQPVVRWCTGRERIKAAASSHRLIDHNGLLGNQVAEDSGNLVWIERAHWHVGPEGLLHRRVLDVGVHRLREPLESVERIVLERSERGDSTSFWRQDAGLVGIAKERHRCPGTNENQALHVLQHL